MGLRTDQIAYLSICYDQIGSETNSSNGRLRLGVVAR